MQIQQTQSFTLQSKRIPQELRKNEDSSGGQKCMEVHDSKNEG